MRNMLKTIKDKLEHGQSLVLVTVIASSGATPRGAGARMLIGKEGVSAVPSAVVQWNTAPSRSLPRYWRREPLSAMISH